MTTMSCCDSGGSGGCSTPQGAQVLSVYYLYAFEGGTTGDLTADNPDGGDKPAFGGGYRFFPDAATAGGTSRNIVRIRAVVTPAQAGICVYFRAFDVDDPSGSGTIDPNLANGRDNRGTVIGAGVNMPGDSVAPAAGATNGYRGRLRAGGTTFFYNEGDVVTVPTTLVNGQAIAEVDLATSFAPGDNFRVVASLDFWEVSLLDDNTGVPTTTESIPNFSGKATPQLSIWRRFHVEQDRMINEGLGDKQSGMITAVPVLVDPLLGIYRSQTTINIAKVNEYTGGIL
jgi:hypothetical protein